MGIDARLHRYGGAGGVAGHEGDEISGNIKTHRIRHPGNEGNGGDERNAGSGAPCPDDVSTSLSGNEKLDMKNIGRCAGPCYPMSRMPEGPFAIFPEALPAIPFCLDK